MEDTTRPESFAETPPVSHATQNARYAFGPFVIDPVKRTLWRDDDAVPITAKTFDVLVVLLEHRERILSKDELLSLVWPNTAVQENNLVRQISSLRRALGQRPEQHDYIVTIPGHGYRFVADVHGVRPLSGSDPAGSIDVSVAGHPALELESADQRGLNTAANAAVGIPSLWGRRRSVTLVATVIVMSSILLLTAVAVTLLRSDDPRRGPRRELQRVTYDEAALPRDAAWAPDGRWIVYASDASGNADLWKQRLGDPNPVRLTNSESSETQPDWSPDGRTIVFRSEREGGGLYVIPSSGGAERMIAKFGYQPVWSPDSTRIMFKRSTVLPDLPSIYVVALDGRPPRPIRPDVVGQFMSLYAAWHPDGRISIWGRLRKGGMKFVTLAVESGNVAVADMSAEVAHDLATLSPGKFVWGKSGRQIYFEAGAGDAENVWRVIVDPRTEKWIDGPERLTTGAGEDTSVAISPDGTRLLFTTTATKTRVWAFPFDPANGRLSGEPYPITHGAVGEVDFDARADGSKVAYYALRAGRNELWERSMTGGEDRLLLSSAEWRFSKPRWSPDGAMLAFSRCPTGDHIAAVAVLNTDGSGERVLTKPETVEMQAYDWSKDGQAILGACRFRSADRYSTCLIPVRNDGGTSDVRVLASDATRDLFNQRFSPDQQWITFLAHDLSYDSTSTVYVVPSSGGTWRRMTEGGWFDDKPRWGPDGRVLYFVSNRSGTPNVWGRRFDSATGGPVGEPFPVTSFRTAQFQLTPRTVQMDIAITSTHLFLPMSESSSDIWMLAGVDR